MKYASNNFIPIMPIDPNFSYPYANPSCPSPIPYPVNNETSNNEERLIPFVGGALLGGIAGNALARPNYYGYGYVPYTPYYPYYPYGNYYTYGGGSIPNNNYNYYYNIPRTTR